MNTSQAPFISPVIVQAALDDMVYSTTSAAQSPLLGLALVDERLLDADLPPSAQQRNLLLHDLLVDLITHTYSGQRLGLGLSPVDMDAPVDRLLSALADDAATASPELLAWAVLYSRYVRVDAALTQPQLADAMSSNPRTIRRYNQHGVRRLTELLVHEEWAARRRQRRRRLALALPSAEPYRLVGREEPLKLLHDRAQGPPPRHVVITGVGGIGKTALVQAFLHQQIETDALDTLVWIDAPSSVAMAEATLRAHLDLTGDLDLREYMLVRSVAIVLDAADALWAEPLRLGALLESWASALVIVISVARGTLAKPHLWLPLPELAPNDAQAFVSTILRDAVGDDTLAGLSADIYRAVGGHPVALALLARDTALLDRVPDDRTLSTADMLLRSRYDALTITERRAWFAFAVVSSSVTVDALLAVWHGLFTEADAVRLAELSLLSRPSSGREGGALSQVARRFLAALFERDESAQAIASALIKRLDRAVRAGNATAFSLMEQVLFAGVLPLPPPLRQDWLVRMFAGDPSVEALPRLRALLEAEVTTEASVYPELRLAYGVCLRRLSGWQDAYTQLSETVTAAGATGNFLAQAHALAEMAVIERYWGHYEAAVNLLERAQRTAERLQVGTLHEFVLLEYAQIAVDRGDALAAMHLLSQLTPSLRVLTLQAEAQVLSANVSAAEALVSEAYDYLPVGDYAAEARLRTILGRTYQAVGNFKRAQAHFAAALTRLEQSDDVFAVNRARANLAAVLIESGAFGDADHLLQQAEAEQLLLADAAGLEATRHNRRIVRLRQATRRG